MLEEYAPGIDVERDILAQADFEIEVSPDLRAMDARLFTPGPMGYAEDLTQKPRLNIPARLH